MLQKSIEGLAILTHGYWTLFWSYLERKSEKQSGKKVAIEKKLQKKEKAE